MIGNLNNKGFKIMDRTEILKKVGNLHQLIDVKPITYREGRADNMSAWQVKNGPLQFTIMKDKCLDIAELTYRGINFSFLSKPGLQGRNHYDTHGDEALRSIMGGMLFTCGFENICAVYHKDGKEYPMHGRIRTTPAEHTGTTIEWKEDICELSVFGEMREAELFGENIVLKRKITTHWPGKTIEIEDLIENQSFKSVPMMILYHFNVGYPLLDKGSEVLIPSLKTTARDEAAEMQLGCWSTMQEPVDNEAEAVFLHDMKAVNGKSWAAVINDKLKLGFCVEYEKNNLPYFMQWKSRASGDYVLGLEPANSSVYGRAFHEQKGDLHMLEPFQTEKMHLTLRILENEELDEMRGKL